jgi:hypothetical protein
MKKETVIKSCYSALGRYTPLDFDCGTLCDGFCCKGGDKLGMLLFPGEETLIDPEIKVVTDNGRSFAVCDGSCERSKRPLSCRIYPLFPVIECEDRIKTIIDIRADCPLKCGEYKFKKSFL